MELSEPVEETKVQHLHSIGKYLALFGAISAALNFFNYNLKILFWIDLWGPTVGWAIRGGAILAGVALMLATRPSAAQGEGAQAPTGG